MVKTSYTIVVQLVCIYCIESQDLRFTKSRVRTEPQDGSGFSLIKCSFWTVWGMFPRYRKNKRTPYKTSSMTLNSMKLISPRLMRENAFKWFLTGQRGSEKRIDFATAQKCNIKNCIRISWRLIALSTAAILNPRVLILGTFFWYITCPKHMQGIHHAFTPESSGMESCSSSETKVNNIASLFLQCLKFRTGYFQQLQHGN